MLVMDGLLNVEETHPPDFCSMEHGSFATF
jgi:hypothetical protein